MTDDGQGSVRNMYHVEEVVLVIEVIICRINFSLINFFNYFKEIIRKLRRTSRDVLINKTSRKDMSNTLL